MLHPYIEILCKKKKKKKIVDEFLIRLKKIHDMLEKNGTESKIDHMILLL